MFKNVLLSFSLLCGFLLPNHINAFSTQIPAVYSWETGDSDASAILMPALPAGYTIGEINSVATDAAGNAVMVGTARNADFSALIPLAYSLPIGATEATRITMDLPDGYRSGEMESVATDAAGNAVMVGYALHAISPGSPVFLPMAYSWAAGATEAKEITLPPLPGETLLGILYSVAIDAAGNAVFVGEGDKAKLVAYKLVLGAIKATLITVERPAGMLESRLLSVAITADGKAIMGGYQLNINMESLPLAYRLDDGATEATRITIPALPASSPRGSLKSVAINTAGNAVMVGDARSTDYTVQIPLAYRLDDGATDATRITFPALPASSPRGEIKSVAINAAGNAVMVGTQNKALTPLAYSWTTGDAAATRIAMDSPGHPFGSLTSVAINTAGNAVMVGVDLYFNRSKHLDRLLWHYRGTLVTLAR